MLNGKFSDEEVKKKIQIFVNFDPCSVLEPRLTPFPYSTNVTYSTERWCTVRDVTNPKPYTLQKNDENGDIIDEKHVVVDVNNAEDDASDR